MVLGLETVCDDMSAEGDQFKSFEFVPSFPTNVVDSKLQAGRAIKQKQDTKGMKFLGYVLLYH